MDPSLELLGFVSKSSPSVEIRVYATDYMVGLTGSKEGREFLINSFGNKLTGVLIELLEDPCSDLKSKAFSAIVNLSADEKATSLLMSDSIFEKLFQAIIALSSESRRSAEEATMALSNIAHWEEGASQIMVYLKTNDETLIYNLIDKFFKTTDCLHYLGSFFSNLTQVIEARKLFLNKEKVLFQKLLSFVSFKNSKIRQHGVVATIKNCCFEIDSHLWLLSSTVNILPSLLLPLAGPEEFDEEDNEKLPVELQYLEEDKKREPDPAIRRMLIEALNQLCATKSGRKIVKDANSYVILREFHKWETDEACMAALENLISVLISDEPQEGMENLNEVDIPKDLEEKMNKLVNII